MFNLIDRFRIVVVLGAIAAVMHADRRASAQNASPTADAEVARQSWKGVVSLPGLSLDFAVALGPDGGTITVPMQGIKGAALHSATLEGRALKFTMAIPGAAEKNWARFEATVAEDGGSAEGTLSQAGQVFPVKLTLLEDGAKADIEPKRPQTPKPPFPYGEREIIYRNDVSDVTLAGTLTIPEGPGPHPAIVFITGSGPQDRDETVFGHKPFAVIADHLARRGVASFRSDDRGVGGSTGNTLLMSQGDFAADALAAVEALKTAPEIDPARIGLLGHSEGGGIAAIAASRSDSVRFVVLAAGVGLPGRDVMRLQSPAILRAEGTLDESMVEEMDRLHAAMTALVIEGAPHDQQREAIRALVMAQAKASNQPEPPDENVTQIIAQQIVMMNSPWMKSFLATDPRDSLRRVRVPVLALNGSLDMQVTPRDNLPAIEGALREAGNPDVTVRELEGLNHLFQTAGSGSLSEYLSIEETFSPTALEMISAWVRERAGLE